MLRHEGSSEHLITPLGLCYPSTAVISSLEWNSRTEEFGPQGTQSVGRRRCESKSKSKVVVVVVVVVVVLTHSHAVPSSSDTMRGQAVARRQIVAPLF